MRRKLAAQFGQQCGGIDAVLVCRLVIDNPQRFFIWGCGRTLWLGSGAEDAIHLNRAQSTFDNASPANFISCVGMRRKNPWRERVAASLTYNFDCLRGHLNGFCGVDACGANGCGNARLLLGEGCKRGLARFSGKSLRQLLEERMNGSTERAGEQARLHAARRGVLRRQAAHLRRTRAERLKWRIRTAIGE